MKSACILFLALILLFPAAAEDVRTPAEQLEDARTLMQNDPLKAREIIDSLLKNLKPSETPGTVCDAMLIKAGSYLFGNENREALEILKTCGSMISQYGLQDLNLTYLKYLGTAYSKLSHYGKALESFYQFLALARQAGDRIETGKAHNNIGLVYIYLGNHEKALTHLYETLRIMEQTGNKPFEAIVLNNIGICQTELKQYHQSLETYSRSLRIKKDLGDREGIGNALNNIGQCLNRFLIQSIS